MSSIQKELNELPGKLTKKWLSVPYAILIVLAAGTSYNLFAYFQQIGAAQGYGDKTMKVIKYTVLFGYYLGFIPGLLVNMEKEFLTFIFAAVQALIAFSTLGYLAENGTGADWEWILMMVMLFVGALSGAMATIGAVVTTIKNFQKRAGTLIIIIVISNFKVAPYFEFSTRSSYFSEMSLMWYFIGVGVVLAVIYLPAAFVIDLVNIDDNIDNVLKNVDISAMLVYVIIEILFLGGYYVVAIVLEDWFIGSILFYVFIALNFIAFGVAVLMIFNRAKRIGPKEAMGLSREVHAKVLYGDYLKKRKFICLIIASFLIIGLTQTFNFNIFQIAFSLGASDSADNTLDAFWIADMLARIGGGLFAYQFQSINEYLYAALSGILAAVGFGLAILTYSAGSSMLWAASIIIGFANGLFWVIAPMTIMDDAGPLSFGLTWGTILFFNALGMLIFGESFDLWYDYEGGDKCSGLNCVLVQFIVFGVLCLIGAGLAYYGFLHDDEEKQAKKGGNQGGAKGGAKAGKAGARGDKAGGKPASKPKDKGAKANSKPKKAESKPKGKPKSKPKAKA